jgi:hypothetical protein
VIALVSASCRSIGNSRTTLINSWLDSCFQFPPVFSATWICKGGDSTWRQIICDGCQNPNYACIFKGCDNFYRLSRYPFEVMSYSLGGKEESGFLLLIYEVGLLIFYRLLELVLTSCASKSDKSFWGKLGCCIWGILIFSGIGVGRRTMLSPCI